MGSLFTFEIAMFPIFVAITCNNSIKTLHCYQFDIPSYQSIV